MTITKEDAAQALGEIDAARGRVFETRSYANASPFLMIWGAVWMFADLALQFAPSWTLAWPIGVALGTLGSIVAGITLPKAYAGMDASLRWKPFALWGVIIGFIVALFLVVP